MCARKDRVQELILLCHRKDLRGQSCQAWRQYSEPSHSVPSPFPLSILFFSSLSISFFQTRSRVAQADPELIIYIAEVGFELLILLHQLSKC